MLYGSIGLSGTDIIVTQVSADAGSICSRAEAGGADAFSYTKDGSRSDPGNDVSDRVSADPLDHAILSRHA